MKKLLIIDGNSVANRAFYALPFLSNHQGKPSGAVFGFANIILKLLQEEKPTNIVGRHLETRYIAIIRCSENQPLKSLLYNSQ